GQRPLALVDVDGLDVVGVPEVGRRPRLEDGDVEAETDLVLGQDHAAALPVAVDDVVLGAVEVVDVDNLHRDLLVSKVWWWWEAQAAVRPGAPRTSRVASSSWSRPAASSSSVIVSG